MRAWRHRWASLLTCAAGAASCIDRYVELRKAEAEGKEDVVVDERLTAIVERLFSRCSLLRLCSDRVLIQPTPVWAGSQRCVLALQVLCGRPVRAGGGNCLGDPTA